ncbi:MAG: hypothetical protein IKR25_05540, partial [Muribaculaceae bacterium]|nr:hypothetical protein [Muribaculaceae bacterium]
MSRIYCASAISRTGVRLYMTRPSSHHMCRIYLLRPSCAESTVLRPLAAPEEALHGSAIQPAHEQNLLYFGHQPHRGAALQDSAIQPAHVQNLLASAISRT